MRAVNVIFLPLAELTFGMCNRLSDILNLFRGVCDGGHELHTTELSIEVPCLWSGYIVKR